MKQRRIQLMMDLAERLAQESKDTSLKVGCVITDEHGERPLGWGWNAGARGQSDERESSESGQSGLVHAEAQALLKTDYSTPNKSVFVTTAPCDMCAKMLVNARVHSVYYKNVYRCNKGIDILRAAGVYCFKVEHESKKESVLQNNILENNFNNASFYIRLLLSKLSTRSYVFYNNTRSYRKFIILYTRRFLQMVTKKWKNLSGGKNDT